MERSPTSSAGARESLGTQKNLCGSHVAPFFIPPCAPSLVHPPLEDTRGSEGCSQRAKPDLTSGPPPGHSACHTQDLEQHCVLAMVDTSHFPLSPEEEQIHREAEFCSLEWTKYVFKCTHFTSREKDRSLLTGQNKQTKKSFASKNHVAWGGRKVCMAGPRTALRLSAQVGEATAATGHRLLLEEDTGTL